MMRKLSVLFLTLFAILSKAQIIKDGIPPTAEFAKAKAILVHTPGFELFDGVIHPEAALFEKYFDIDAAADEHREFIEALRTEGIDVYNVKDILRRMDKTTLCKLAADALKYDATLAQETVDESERERLATLQTMSVNDLIRVIIFRPSIVLRQTEINTHYQATYAHSPLMNLYFLRDQSISTPCGQVMGRMNSVQRHDEVDVIEACYRTLGIPPVYRIKGEDNLLEGGDYMPCGTFAVIADGLRTNLGAIHEMMQADVLGHDTIVVVRDRWMDQYQMHLDTYFNVIDRDLVTLCFNRFDATPDDEQHLTIEVYARQPGTKTYEPIPALTDSSFKTFLTNRGINIIRISEGDADDYANNYLTIDARHIISVAVHSEELEEEFRKYGVKVKHVNLENLMGGYGASHCMTQVVRRAK